MTEQQLANEIMGWMRTFKWLVFHVRNSGMGNISQVQGDKGFPDLIGIQREQGRLLVAELKVGKVGTLKGSPRPEQLAWLAAFAGIGNELWHPIETYIWRPGDLPSIVRILRSR